MKIKNKLTTVLIATLIAGIGIPAALAATPDQNYATYCAGCHGADRTGGVGPDITPAGLAVLGITTSAQIDTILTTGVMSSMASALSAADKQALSDWLINPPATPAPTPTPAITPTPTPTATPTVGVFDENTNITFSHGNITSAQIAEIQPGLGTVMREYGYRMWVIYYAARDGNWDLASYQLKEALEIQETGEITRPGRAVALKAFESAYLVPLNDTINAKDWTAFQSAYISATNGCNACHAGNRFPYIHYTLPLRQPDLLFAPAASKVGVYDGIGTFELANETATAGADAVGFGFANTVPVAGDWNGDGKTKIGFYNKNANNFVLKNPDGTATIIGLGFAGATPVVGDWNGDRKTEVGVYDGNGTWALENTSSPTGVDIIGFGFPNTIPVVGDWNGDGTTDIGVYNIAGKNFVLRNSDGTATVIGLGWTGVTPVVGDWNGDGKDKVAVYDNMGTWALENTSASGGADIVGFGFTNTTPVVGDWNGDGTTKVGFYNKNSNNFVLRNPDGTATIVGLGFAGATPVVGKWS